MDTTAGQLHRSNHSDRVYIEGITGHGQKTTRQAHLYRFAVMATTFHLRSFLTQIRHMHFLCLELFYPDETGSSEGT